MNSLEASETGRMKSTGLRTFSFVTALCACALVSTPASQPLGKDLHPTSARMMAALETVKPDNIKADLYFVASDEMGGRDTPSAEQRIVARFLRARLERLGWKPAAPNGYLYTYPLELRRLDEARSTIQYSADSRKGTLHVGRDYFLPSSNDVRTSRVGGKVVFAGKGSKSDFETKGLEGKWALCFDDGSDVREVGRRARRAKCAGLLLAPGPDYQGEAYSERFRPQLERQRKGSARWPEKSDPDADKEERREVFASVMLTREAVQQILSAAHEPETPRVGAAIGELTEERLVAGDGKVDVENVCGLWPGSDPELGQETILITAHYDHIGTIDGVVNNGADDNGSGTCGLLAIAEALASHRPLRRSVMLMWVSGEEKGLWGSKAWTEHPFLPDGRKPICDINIDMIGRNAPAQLLITPTRDRPKDFNGLVELAESLAPLEGFPQLASADDYYTRSDHYNFAKLGIPVAFLFDDVHADYHKPTDDPDKIDYDKIRRVVRLVLRMVDGLQADTLELKSN